MLAELLAIAAFEVTRRIDVPLRAWEAACLVARGENVWPAWLNPLMTDPKHFPTITKTKDVSP